MAFEIPRDLIKQLQISLRNEAKISSYDPHDPSLPNLPSLHETIAELDPSPPYLRCKHLNLAGVDLDFYFSEEKKDTTSKASDEPPPLNKQTVEDNVDLNLFDKVPSTETATTTTKHESDDSFSGWEASFQTASSATSHDNSKSVDPFAVSGVNMSSSLETTFGDQNKSRSGGTEDTNNPSSSITNDWFQQQDDLWSSSNHGTIHMPDQVEQTGSLIDGRAAETANYSSSASVDWFQDDQRQGGSQKKPDDKSVFKDDDSADAWDDFTSSTGVQGPSDNSRKDIVNDVVPKVDEISEVDFFSTTTSKDSDFRNSSQPNSFAEAFPKSIEKVAWPDASDLSRMSEENGETGENSEAMKSQAASGPSSSTDDVQMVMAKMHDLSFMLESNLSVPPK